MNSMEALPEGPEQESEPALPPPDVAPKLKLSLREQIAYS